MNKQISKKKAEQTNNAHGFSFMHKTARQGELENARHDMFERGLELQLNLSLHVRHVGAEQAQVQRDRGKTPRLPTRHHLFDTEEPLFVVEVLRALVTIQRCLNLYELGINGRPDNDAPERVRQIRLPTMRSRLYTARCAAGAPSNPCYDDFIRLPENK